MQLYVFLVAQEILLNIRPTEIDARFHRHDHVWLEPAGKGGEIRGTGHGGGVVSFSRVSEHASQVVHADVLALLLYPAIGDGMQEVSTQDAMKEKIRSGQKGDPIHSTTKQPAVVDGIRRGGEGRDGNGMRKTYS
jgi:hypothetical protein